jgi:N12 class adenine-specific DNA methylase
MSIESCLDIHTDIIMDDDAKEILRLATEQVEKYFQSLPNKGVGATASKQAEIDAKIKKIEIGVAQSYLNSVFDEYNSLVDDIELRGGTVESRATIAAESIDDFALTTQTEQDFDRQAAEEKARKKQQAEADAKADADAQVSSFTLSASTRPADEIAARGTGDMLVATRGQAQPNTPARISLGSKAAGDVLQGEDGERYRIEGIDLASNQIRTTRNPDQLSERVVLMGQDRFNRLVKEDGETKDQARTTPVATQESTPTDSVKWFGSEAKAIEWIGKQTNPSEYRIEANNRRFEIFKNESAPKKEYGSDNKIFTADAAEKARQVLKSKLNNLNTGIDPETLQAGLTLAGYHIEAGARSFAAYSKAMIDDLGDGIKPYLRSFYESVRYYPGFDSKGMSSPDEVNAALANQDAAPNNEVEAQNTEVQDNATDDRTSQGALERVPSEEVRGTSAGRREGAKQGAVRSGQTDNAGNGPAGRVRNERPGSVASGQGDIFATQAGAASDEKHGYGGLVGETTSTDFTITEDFDLGAGGEVKKFNDNIAAIKLLKTLQADSRRATKSEQEILARYVGWGGIPQAFLKSDGTTRSGWGSKAAELKALLSDEEYSAARRSTQDAHYTSKPVVDAIFNAVARLGFKKGKILEPSVGVGNFFGLMPASVRSGSSLNAVELDAITGGIAKQLYQSASIQSPMGFQDFPLADGTYDLAIGNPPFGSQSIYDGKRKQISKFSIHNYFFGKSLDALRDDGILAMVVSKGLMDKPVSKEREYFATKAELIGAIRLPNNAFKANAGTEVTTDIIFLRKLGPGETADTSWSQTAEYTNQKGESFVINKYFADNPDMMLGEMTYEGSMYRANEPALSAPDNQDIAAELAKAIAKLPEGIYSAKSTSPRPAKEKATSNVAVDRDQDRESFIKPNGYYYRGDNILIRSAASSESGAAQFIDASTRVDSSGDVKPLNASQKDRIKGMVDIGIAVSRVIDSQINGTNNETLDTQRKALNLVYDAFVKKHGYINSTTNKSLMRADPSWPRISALEVSYDKGISLGVAKSTGQKARTPSAKKADIFTKRTQQPYTPVSKVLSAKEGLMVSLSEKGVLDIDHISKIYGKDTDAVIKELGNLIYEDPANGWETSEQYLSGNVKIKLRQAIEAANNDEKYSRNVDALQKVIPADIPAVDIKVKLGAPWVPPKTISSFIDHLAGREVGASFTYARSIAKWAVQPYTTTPKLNNEWGASGFDAVELIMLASNGKNPSVYKDVPDGQGGKTRALDKEATDAAIQKSNEIKEEFDDWVWRSAERREELGRIYNDAYNTSVNRSYDGSHLELPGKVPEEIISLRPHQKNFIWRVLQGQTTLADHVVGAGKTFAMIGAAMELKRTGLAKKPAIVVPNHLVQQWTNDFMALYPSANVLAPTKQDFQKSARKELFARVATGDWDAVIIAHSSFGKLPSDIEQEKLFINQQIKDLEESIDELRVASGKDPRTVKDAEKAKDRLQEKLKELMDSSTKDTDNLNFAELGIDALFVDEAHEFKNLAYQTSQGRLPGLGNPEGAKKSQDLFVKVQSVLSKTGGRNIVFATGTPISNSMVELYTMQRYLGYDELRSKGLAHVDAWINLFGEIVSDFELDSTAQGYKINSRLAKFVNMPELVQMYNRFADSITRNDINEFLKKEGKVLPIPKVKGGKPENVIVSRSAEQSAYMADIVERAQNIPKDKRIDNMLKITSDARKSALDMRLIDPSSEHDEGGKIAAAVDNINRIAKGWDADKGTQLVFLDLSTPKKAVAKEKAAYTELVRKADEGDEDAIDALGKYSNDDILALESDFSVYDELKYRLILSGFPEQEIAFIHDANTDDQKDALFAKVRAGQIRVLIGSTAKMGAGTNVQERLVALHHMDAPWRPSDLEQREGRIIRQGNALYNKYPDFEIEILRYATERTYDSRMWQTIEVKARFIEQMRAGAVDSREIEDIAGEAASAAEMKAVASGNPLILEEFKLRADISKLVGLKKAHDRKQFGIIDSIKSLERRIDSLPKAIESAELDAKRLESNPFMTPTKENPTGFVLTVAGVEHSKRDEAGKALALEMAKFLKSGKSAVDQIGSYRGFTISLDRVNPKKVEITLVGNREYAIELPQIELVAASGLAARIQNALGMIPTEAARLTKALEDAKNDLAETRMAEGAPFKQEQELKELRDRHKKVLAELSGSDKEKAAPGADAPAFSRTAGSRSTIPISRAKTLADAIKSNFENAPDVFVVQDMQDAQVPEAVRREDARQRSQGAQGAPEGFYYKGQAFIVLDGLTKRKGESDAQAIVRVFAHEVLGHAGLRGLFRGDLDKVLSEVAMKRRGDVRIKASEYGLDISNREDRLVAAEEVLAELAQTEPSNSIVTKAIEIIRRALRAMLMKLPAEARTMLGGSKFIEWVNSMTDAEIIDRFIVPAREFIRGGAEAAADAMPVFQRSQSRPVNEQAGLDRAKSIVEEAGYQWSDVKQITSKEERQQYQRRYGIPSAVSERDDTSDVFNKAGLCFGTKRLAHLLPTPQAALLCAAK